MTWHSDLSGIDNRQTFYTVLYSLHAPGAGGETRFANMYAAYESMPQARQRELDGMRMIYTYETLYNRRREALERKGIDHGYKPLSEGQMEFAKRRQIMPIVDADPRSGRKWLHVSPIGCAGVEGMSDEDGIALVNEIVDYATAPCFRYDHAWRVRDLVMWDNHGLFHVAGEYDKQKYQRTLYRCSVAG
jgi:taurine dioxygenase